MKGFLENLQILTNDWLLVSIYCLFKSNNDEKVDF